MGVTEDQAKPKTRMVHIRLPEELHKKVRIPAAEDDVTIQDWVVEAIQAKLKEKEKIDGIKK